MAKKKKIETKSTPLLDFAVLIGLLPFVSDYTLFNVGAPIRIVEAATIAFLANLVIHPIAMVGAIVRRRWGLLIFGLLAGHVALAAVAIDYFDLAETGQWIRGWLFAAQISFLYFSCRGRLWSLGFAVFALLSYFLAGASALLMFVAASIGVKVVAMAVTQNYETIRSLGFVRAGWITTRALVYWTPILAFAVPATVATQRAHDQAVQAVYDFTSVEKDTGSSSSDSNFENDITKAVSLEHDRAGKILDRRIEGFKTQVKSGAQEIPEAAVQVFDSTIPVGHQIPPLAPQDCAWYDIPCHIKEGVKSSVRASYDRSRWRQRIKLEAEVRKRSAEGSSSATDMANHLQTRMGTYLTESKERMNSAIKGLFLGLRASQIVANVLFMILCLKSFLYVWARVAFAKDSTALVTLQSKKGRMPVGNLRKCGTKFSVRGGKNTVLFVSRKYEPTGRAPRFWIPQPGSAVLARLRRGLMILNRVDFQPGEGSVHFNAVKGAEFLEWSLSEGETVVFDIKHFVGMTSDVRLSSIVSLRISSLLLGRMIFPAAHGPGKLILLTHGTPTLPNERIASSSVPPNRIVGFQQNARFHVDSHLNFLDLYFSAAYLRRVGNDPVLIDADVVGKAQTGLGRFIKYFLLPV